MTNLVSRNDAKAIATSPTGVPYNGASRPSGQAATSAADSERNEIQLIARIKGGDVEAFYELGRPYERAVFLAASSLVRNDAMSSTSVSTKLQRSSGLSEANVKTRLCRARLQMRDSLAPGFDGAWSRGRAYEKVRPF